MNAPRAGTLAVLASCLLAAGCPYESPVPAGPPAEGTLDARLLGRWVMPPDEAPSLGYAEVDILAFSEAEYYVEFRAHEPFKEPEVTRYRAYSAKVGGREYLNLRQLPAPSAPAADKPPGWLLAVCEFSNAATLNLSLVGDELLKKEKAPPATTGALRAFLKKHAGSPGLLEKPFVLRRRT